MRRAHLWATPFLLAAAWAGTAGGVETATSVATTLEQATQALADAVAPGQRTVWERYTDPDFVYVTEDNEVKPRNTMLAELQPLPPGYTGSLKVEEFRCSSFGAFAVTTYILDEHETIEGHALHARYRSSDTCRATEGGWRLVATQVYAIQQDPERTTLPTGRLAEYAGWYALSAGTRQEIRRDGDHLVAERAGRAPQVLLPESGDVFFTPGRPRTRRIFTRDADGRVSGFADRREGTDLAWTRVEAPAPAR